MTQRKWMVVLAVALSAGSTLVAQAAPTKTDGKVLLAAKGDKANKGNKAGKGGNRVQLIAPQMLEKILGKPLTDDQKKGIKDAADAYNEAVAKSLGMTVDELKAKAQEYRKNNPGGGGAKKAA